MVFLQVLRNYQEVVVSITMIRLKILIKGLDVLEVTLRLLVLRKARSFFRILHPNPIVSVNIPPTATTSMNIVCGIGHSVVDLKFFSDYFTWRGC